MFGIPRKYSEAIRAIADGHSFLQDVGVISYYKASYKQSRYMANVAGVGFDAFVNRKYNHLKEEGKKGKWLYLWSTLKAVRAIRRRASRCTSTTSWSSTIWYTARRSESVATTEAACFRRPRR